jgi:L-aminopeptidase/D-esterase-like protein
VKRLYNSITDISGIKVGHAENKSAKTGCTVIICGTEGMSCGVDIRGGAPGTREIALLNPAMKINKVNAILFTGGSAYGLDAAGGVMKYLEENNIGYEAGGIKIPIVPTAVIFDLALGNPSIRPDLEMGYQAASNAKEGIIKTGSVGVGTGATVGKINGMKYCMKSGIGTVSFKDGDLIVAALVVTNSLGNIYNPDNGKIIAGARDIRGNFISSNDFSKIKVRDNNLQSNTTLAVVASNANFDKTDNTRLAIMAQDGISRTIKPVHTMYDGDIVFSISDGNIDADINKVGSIAAELVSQAVINSVKF